MGNAKHPPSGKACYQLRGYAFENAAFGIRGFSPLFESANV
jgi:hypothetical protein